MTPPLTAAGFESPSLAGDGAGTAYELKFLLDEAVAQGVEDWARARLALDPHGDPALGGAYRTTSLYFDTAALDVYRRAGIHRLHKFRVRRYGSMAWAFLERKSREERRVRKKRTAVPAEDVRLLALPGSLKDWPGRWFQRDLRSHGLLPACRVGYLRTAFAGESGANPLRLTLDRQVRGALAEDCGLALKGEGRALLAGHVILELKFRDVLPAPLEGLVRELNLTPSTLSKYRLCRGAWGVPDVAGVAVTA
jgi:hypothetical protein